MSSNDGERKIFSSARNELFEQIGSNDFSEFCCEPLQVKYLETKTHMTFRVHSYYLYRHFLTKQ